MQTWIRASLFCLSISPLLGQQQVEIDKDLINDPHFREEHGLNAYTRPSIDKIFEQLDKLSPLPVKEVPFKLPKRMPLERENLAIEIGFLISEGFLAVQAGDMKKVQELAAKLSTYSNALGAGEKVKGHAASILEHSKKNEIAKLKKELSATQDDVEKELILLQDVDLAHLISLGGWLRALEVSTLAVDKKFSEERAKLLYREDIADYYEYALNSMKPSLKNKANFKALTANMTALKKVMLLKDAQKPTKEGMATISKLTKDSVAQALKR